MENRHQDPEAIEEAFRGPDGRGWLMRWLSARAHDNAMLLDPYGRILAETWAADDAMVVAGLDLDLIPLSTGRRWPAGLRPELYGILTRRFDTERDPPTTRFATEPVPLIPPTGPLHDRSRSWHAATPSLVSIARM